MRAVFASLALLLLAVPALVAAPEPAFAQSTKAQLEANLKQTGETGAGFSAQGRTNPLAIVTQIIRVVLSLLGVIFLAITIYGGYRWMMARGNEQEVEKAKETLKTGVIGLAIMLASYIIAINVMVYLLQATGQPATFF